MITVGVDVASQPARTAACHLLWTPGNATIQGVRLALDDQALKHLLSTEHITKLGVDVPLGWPDAYVRAISAHHDHRPWGDEPQKHLTLRATDRWVAETLRQRPLSVSADRIAYPALRVAALAGPMDRSGEGRVVEVYPAAALRVWALPYRRYKRVAGQKALASSVGDLRRPATWLHNEDDVWRRLSRNDDLFDALIAALVAPVAAVNAGEEVDQEPG
jgi:hypothetical protein